VLKTAISKIRAQITHRYVEVLFAKKM